MCIKTKTYYDNKKISWKQNLKKYKTTTNVYAWRMKMWYQKIINVLNKKVIFKSVSGECELCEKKSLVKIWPPTTAYRPFLKKKYMLYSYLLTLMILWVKKQLELYETDLRNGCWFTKCLPAASVASATTTVGYTKFLLSCCLLHNTVVANLQWTVKPTTSAVVVEKIWWLRATVAIQASA